VNSSSRRDPRAYLWDAIEAAGYALHFCRGKSRDDYATDVLLRSGVERQLSIVGEALNQLSRVDADLADRIPELRSIVGFRNILVHGYREVDDDIVWLVVAEQLPGLLSTVRTLLAELDP
jgi:uncharacterized protein with HEPN domain